MISDSQRNSTIGLTFNPSSINNLELREFASGLSLSTNGFSLNSWASDAGLSSAVQLQDSKVMQVALLSSASGSVARQVCAGRMNIPPSLGWAQTPSRRRTYRAHPTLLLYGPDHRTAARVGNARKGGSLGAEGVAEGGGRGTAAKVKASNDQLRRRPLLGLRQECQRRGSSSSSRTR